MPATKISSAVESFLAESPLQLFIGGQWRPAAKKQTFEVIDPGAGARLAQIYDSGAEDVDAAVQAAPSAMPASAWFICSKVRRVKGASSGARSGASRPE